jgi:hypothetical protein
MRNVSRACLTSMIRLHFIVKFANSSDPTCAPQPSQLSSETANKRPGDNVDAVIWSTLEVSVATVCACLPAIRALLSRSLPSLFDTSNISSYNSQGSQKDNSSPHLDPGNLTVLNTSTSSRISCLQKMGPSYNKHVVVAPDDELLFYDPQLGEFRDIDKYGRTYGRDGQETKVWINPRFDPDGNVVECQGTAVERRKVDKHISHWSTDNISLWMLEGPMVGDVEVGIVREAKSVELGSSFMNIEAEDIGVAVSTREEPMRADYMSGRPKLQRVWVPNTLPPFAMGGRSEYWV